MSGRCQIQLMCDSIFGVKALRGGEMVCGVLRVINVESCVVICTLLLMTHLYI